MDAELVQLAREAVSALPLQAAAAGGMNGGEGGQLGLSGPGRAALLIGLAGMKESGQRRACEIDELAAAFRKQGAAMLQAFTRQGHALDRQGPV